MGDLGAAEMRIGHYDVAKETSVPNFAAELRRLRYGDVRGMIVPQGPCAALDVDVRRVTDAMYATDPVVAYTEKQFGILRPYLVAALTDTAFLSSVAKVEGVIPRELISTLGAGGPMVDRLSMIVNHGIDPEGIPLAMSHFFREAGVSKSYMDVLTRDIDIRYGLGELFSDEAFVDAFFLEGAWNWKEQKILRDPLYERLYERFMEGGNRYELGTMEDVNNLITFWAGQVAKQEGIDLHEARRPLETFFRLPSFGGEMPVEIRTSAETILFRTCKYFQKSSQPASEYFFRANIQEHARAYERGAYLVALYRTVRETYKHFFPEVFVESKVRGLSLSAPEKVFEFSDTWSPNGFWNDADRIISIVSGIPVGKNKLEVFNEVSMSTYRQVAVRRKVDDFITMTHEFAHSLFSKLRRQYLKRSTIEYSNTVDSSVNEGFAVLMEMLAIDIAARNPQICDFDSVDIKDLMSEKRARQRMLDAEWSQPDKSTYAEGAYGIMNHVYLDGAGKGPIRDMHSGLTAVAAFVKALDSDKTIVTPRSDRFYRRVLESGSPHELLSYFSRTEYRTLLRSVLASVIGSFSRRRIHRGRPQETA